MPEVHATDAGIQASVDGGGEPPRRVDPPPPQDECWKDRRFRLEVLAFILLAAYTISSWLQWYEIRRTNNLTTKALEVQTRPWLGIEGGLGTLIESTVSPDGVYFTFSINLHDYGNAPAVDIFPLVPAETSGGRFGPGPGPLDGKKLCDAANDASRNASPEYGGRLLVWPGTSTKYNIRTLSKGLAGTFVPGCLSYKSPSGAVHDTFFVYHVFMDYVSNLGHISSITLETIEPLQ